MTDLLTPDEIREMLQRAVWEELTARQRQPVARLCRDYLTLWDETHKLRREVAELADAFATLKTTHNA